MSEALKWLWGRAADDPSAERWVLGALACSFAWFALRSAGSKRQVHACLALGFASSIPGSLVHVPTRILVLSAASVGMTIWVLRDRMERLPRWSRALRVRLLRRLDDRTFDALTAIVVFTIATAIGFFVFHFLPVIQDSQAQLFHAQIFLRGHVVAPSPPSPLHFLADHVIVEPAFYSQYPPLHSAVLALGVALGAPHLINPLLGALTVPVLRRIGQDLYGRVAGRRAALFYCASPFVLMMSSEFMNHASSLLLVACAVLGVMRVKRGGGWNWTILAGLASGAHLLVRPISAIGIGLPLALWALGSWRTRWRELLSMAGLALAVGSLFLLFNQETNGDPWVMGYTVRWGPNHTLGFHAAPWGEPHTPWRGLDRTLSTLSASNLFLLGGGIPALALMMLGALRDGTRSATWALGGGWVLTLVIYFLYFFSDIAFGPRYLYEGNIAAFVFVSRGSSVLVRAFPAIGWKALAASYFAALLVFWPPLLREYAVGFNLRGEVVDVAQREVASDERALVFIEGDFARAFYANDPWLENRILFAKDLGDVRNLQLQCAMPERTAYKEVSRRLQPLPVPVCAQYAF